MRPDMSDPFVPSQELAPDPGLPPADAVPEPAVPRPDLAPGRPAGARSEGLARSAGILGFGNIASRVIGLARDTITANFFGASGQLSAFTVASNVPTMIFDLLVGGMLSAALVPVFSGYARDEQREELSGLASAVLTLIALVMGSIVLLLEIFAVPIAGLLATFPDPALQQVLVRCLRVIAPAVLLFGLSGGLTGLLYSLKRFSYTALGGAVFNLGIVIAAPLLARRLGIYCLPLGVLLGSLAQMAVMSAGLRDLRLRLTGAWTHPAVRRIMHLYLPIALGLIVTEIQIIVDRRWASGTGAQSVSWMRYATTLIQLPLGLVPVAVSLAALPSLAQRAQDNDWETFRSIFARGLRLVLVLLVPATAGLFALAQPIVRLLFQHGVFAATDTAMTGAALRLYLAGLPFAGVDFLLNYTYYARQDTRTPAVVGVVAVGFYFAAALALKPVLGFLGLVLADSVKQAAHAVIMTVLLTRSVGWVGGHGVERTALKAGAAALAMGLLVWLLAERLGSLLPGGLLGQFVLVALAAGTGAGFYLLMLRLLGVREVVDLARGVAGRLRPARP
jgi:putative peptidoglycan lipid II flippase